jgi:hypothetical protein
MFYEEDFYNQHDEDESMDSRVKGKSHVNVNTNSIANVSSDKYMHKVVVNGVKRSVNVFSCGDTGSPIRNAVSGHYYGPKHTVGSVMEDLYFRVSCQMSSGRKKLYFDSPEQYERHIGNRVADLDGPSWGELKRAWGIKKMARLQKM